jgi:hypothetical protein
MAERRQLSAAAQKALFFSLLLCMLPSGLQRTFSFIHAHYLCVSLLINKDTALNENLFQK